MVCLGDQARGRQPAHLGAPAVGLRADRHRRGMAGGRARRSLDGADHALAQAVRGARFVAVVLLLDRLLRDRPAMRLRAHLLWSVNPLLLWEIVATGHIDGLAVAFGLSRLAPCGSPPTASSPRWSGARWRAPCSAAAACTSLRSRSSWSPRCGRCGFTANRLPGRRLPLAGGDVVRVAGRPRSTCSSCAVAGHLGQPVPAVLSSDSAWAADWLRRRARLGLPAGAGAVHRRRPARLLPAADRVPGLPAVSPALALSLA